MKRIGIIMILTVYALSAFSQEKTQVIDQAGNHIVFTKKADLTKKKELKGYSRIFSSSGNSLAIGFKGGVQVWNTDDGSTQVLLGEKGNTYWETKFSLNSESVAATDGKRIFTWNLDRPNNPIIISESVRPESFSISPEGSYLFFYVGRNPLWGYAAEKSSFTLWDLQEDVAKAELRPERLPIYGNGYDPLYDKDNLNLASANFSPDGKTVAVEYSYRIYLWDVNTGKVLRRLVDPSLPDERSSAAIYRVVFSSNGKLLASSAWDGTVALWEVETGKFIRRLEIGDRVWGVTSISGDNRFVLTGDRKGKISLWEISTGKMLWEAGKGNYRPSLSSLEVGLISVESGDIYNLRTGEKLGGIKGEFLSDGKLLVKEKDGNMSTWVVQRN